MNHDKPLPDQDVFDSAELLMRRITAQLTTQLARVRPPGTSAARPMPLTRR
jgi:hypothetical protein